MCNELKNYTVRVLHNAGSVIEELLKQSCQKESSLLREYSYYYQKKLRESLDELKEAENFLRHEVP